MIRTNIGQLMMGVLFDYWTTIVKAILDFKHQHPKWGAYATTRKLKRDYPGRPWPAVSTVGEIFDRHGLVKKHNQDIHNNCEFK